MSIKARVLRAEGSIRVRNKKQHGRVILVFTDEEKDKMEIQSGNNSLFTGTIEEGNEFIKNIDFPVVILPGADPRWCS